MWDWLVNRNNTMAKWIVCALTLSFWVFEEVSFLSVLSGFFRFCLSVVLFTDRLYLSPSYCFHVWRFLVLCVFPSVSSSCVFLLNLRYSRVCVSLFTSSFSLKLFVSCIPLYFPSCLLVMDCSHLCDYPHLCLIPLDSSTSLITPCV